MPIPARLSIVTLGVADVARSVAFYEALGWQRRSSSMDEIAWFDLGGTYLGVFGWDALAEDAGLAGASRGRFGGITLAINVASDDAVRAALETAVAAGGTILKAPVRFEWGMLSAYFADPDGHPWEVAFNPSFPIDDEGRTTIP